MSFSRRSFLQLSAAALAGAGLTRAGSCRGRWDEVVRYHRRTEGRSLVIVQGGKTVFRDGDSAAHELASGTKSFWGLLAVLLQKEGRLSLDEELGQTLTEWQGDPRGRITIHQLLTLSSGLEGGPNGRPPTFRAALKTKLVDRPGTVFHYGPCPYQLFGEVLRRKFAKDPLHLAEERIFLPAAVHYESWKRGADGNIHLPSGAQMAAAEWARFGVWVMAHRQEFAPCFEGTSANPAYGLTWWLNRPVPREVEPNLFRAMREVVRVGQDPAIPRDLCFAAGAGDQRLYLLPAQDLVVSRQASRILGRLLRGGSGWSDLHFLKLVLAGA